MVKKGRERKEDEVLAEELMGGMGGELDACFDNLDTLLVA